MAQSNGMLGMSAPGMQTARQSVEDVDKSMKTLRESMRGMQIRTAGFKKHHDEAARQVARATVDLVEAYGAMNEGK